MTMVQSEDPFISKAQSMQSNPIVKVNDWNLIPNRKQVVKDLHILFLFLNAKTSSNSISLLH